MMVKLHRQVGAAKKPRHKLPQPIQPRPIEREYAKEIINFIRAVKVELQPLFDAIPSLLASVNYTTDSDIRFDAGEGKKIRELAEKARSNIKSRLNITKLESIVEKFGTRTSEFQKQQLKKQAKAALGVDLLGVDKNLKSTMERFVAENVSHITSIPEKLIGNVERTITRAVKRGAKPAEVAKDLRKSLAKTFDLEENRAKFIARDQIGSLYGQINAERQQALGITEFIWRTVGDQAVRPEHQDRDGETYEFEDPPDGELPGEPINCRCYAEPVFAGILGEI